MQLCEFCLPCFCKGAFKQPMPNTCYILLIDRCLPTKCSQRTHPLWMECREHESNDGSITKCKHIHMAEIERVEQGDHISNILTVILCAIALPMGRTAIAMQMWREYGILP